MMMLIRKEFLGINGVDDCITLYLSVAFSKVHLFLTNNMTNDRKLENHKRDCILIILESFNVDKEIFKEQLI